MKRLASFAMFVVAALFAPAVALAAPSVSQLATVLVLCDTRQGSGAFTSTADGGYVVTVGHVPIDSTTNQQAASCKVGFVTDDTLKPTTFFSATVVHATFGGRTDRDLAVLRLGGRVGGPAIPFPAPMRTNEFGMPGDAMTTYGFPGGSGTMQAAAGAVRGYARGTMTSSAVISPGYSGGPAVDANGFLLGTAERVRYEIDEKTGEQHVTDYEYGDVLALINWLDTFGPNEHDKYLMHADNARFHGAPYVSRDENSGCAYVVRTRDIPTVYCLLSGPERLVFPNEATFYSWYGSTADVRYIGLDNVAEYRLIGNVTLKAGSLVKITTDPVVYVVTDSIGTIRAIPSEERAAALFGANWAGKVRDVPDAFFIDYHVGQPLP